MLSLATKSILYWLVYWFETGSYYVAQTDLKFLCSLGQTRIHNPPASDSLVLGLQAWSIIFGSHFAPWTQCLMNSVQTRFVCLFYFIFSVKPCLSRHQFVDYVGLEFKSVYPCPFWANVEIKALGYHLLASPFLAILSSQKYFLRFIFPNFYGIMAVGMGQSQTQDVLCLDWLPSVQFLVILFWNVRECVSYK